MRLTIKNISAFLMEKGLLEPKSVVDGNFMVTQTQNRNAIFKIYIRNGKSLFVKQLVSFDPQNTYFLQKDATCLWLIKNEKAFAGISGFVPDYYGYDPEKQVLIVEYIPEAKNLEEVYQKDRKISPEMMDQVGRILSTYHFKLEGTTLTNRSVQFFMRQFPWPFQLARSSQSYLKQMEQQNSGNPVVSYLKANPDFLELVQKGGRDYEFTSLIHGDIKWVNFILEDDNRPDTLKLIDWELADIGDPLWDVAGVFQSLFTSKVILSATTAPYQGQTNITEKEMQQTFAEIDLLWEAYCNHRAYPEGEKEKGLEKALRFTGIRLVQTAFEHNVNVRQITPNAIKLLQISHALLQSTAVIMQQITNQNTTTYEPVHA